VPVGGLLQRTTHFTNCIGSKYTRNYWQNRTL
jgi:hypothetical protein